NDDAAVSRGDPAAERGHDQDRRIRPRGAARGSAAPPRVHAGRAAPFRVPDGRGSPRLHRAPVRRGGGRRSPHARPSRRAGAGGQGARAARGAVPGHEAEARRGVRPPPRPRGPRLRRAVDRHRPGRHPEDEADDRAPGRGRSFRHRVVASPAARGGDLLPSPRPLAREGRALRVARGDFPARHGRVVSASPSPLPLVFFAAKRMLRNAARKKLGRLREARYMVGFLVGAAYFAMLFMRPSRAGRPQAPPRLPAHMGEILLFAGAAALAAAALLTWLFRRGQPSLGLSEAEIQFLFPAPVSRRALLHYALLKAQFPVLLSAFILTIVSGRRGNGTAILSGFGLWLLLTAVHFHNLALSFTKARWNALPPASRRATKIAVFAVAGSALGVLAVTFGAGVLAAMSDPGRGSLASLGGLVAALRSWPFGSAPLALLAPFRWILAPLFAPTARAFSLPKPSRPNRAAARCRSPLRRGVGPSSRSCGKPFSPGTGRASAGKPRSWPLSRPRCFPRPPSWRRPPPTPSPPSEARGASP